MKTARTKETKTGGREATTRHIPPIRALAVGMPKTPAPAGWIWAGLADVARMESGHTPSRRHPEYWDGDVPWISITDARDHHGKIIHCTKEQTNSLGLANSSARLLPAETVCLSRTASVGYVTVTGCPMATSQDFVNWICSEQILPRFLQYLFLAEGEDLLRFASGSVHQTIYYPEAKAFHICFPSLAEQRRIVAILDEAFEGIAAAKANADTNLKNAKDVLLAYLSEVFGSGTDAMEMVPVKKMAHHCLGKMLDKKKNRGTPRPYLRNQNVRWFSFDLGDVSEMRFEKDEEDKFSARYGDLLICEGGYPGRAAVWDSAEPIYLQKAIHRVRFHNLKYTKWFLYYLFWLEQTGRLRQHCTGTGILHFTGKSLAELPVPIPSDSDADRYSRTFEQLRTTTDGACETLNRKLTALDELKASLLHKAFTGQL